MCGLSSLTLDGSILTDVVGRADDVAHVVAGVDGAREAEVAQLDVSVRVGLSQQDVVWLQHTRRGVSKDCRICDVFKARQQIRFRKLRWTRTAVGVRVYWPRVKGQFLLTHTVVLGSLCSNPNIKDDFYQ